MPAASLLCRYGDDKDEAFADAREALTRFLRSMRKHHDPIPENDLKRRGLEIIEVVVSTR